MNFYDRKVKAFRRIDGLLRQGRFSENSIEYIIMKDFGFGSKVVQDYLSKIRERLNTDRQGWLSFKEEQTELKNAQT